MTGCTRNKAEIERAAISERSLQVKKVYCRDQNDEIFTRTTWIKQIEQQRQAALTALIGRSCCRCVMKTAKMKTHKLTLCYCYFLASWQPLNFQTIQFRFQVLTFDVHCEYMSAVDLKMKSTIFNVLPTVIVYTKCSLQFDDCQIRLTSYSLYKIQLHNSDITSTFACNYSACSQLYHPRIQAALTYLQSSHNYPTSIPS